MPFDGIVTKCIFEELSNKLVGGRIEKIFQPEADEIMINVRAWNQNYRLLLSASASYPRIHITEAVKENPAAPPVFCMLLRKHLSGGKILGLEFHDYERIIGFVIEATNELGDISEKKLIIEIMGRHSNIILINSENKIIDAIKHVDNEISRVREVMPARLYMLPPGQNKTIPDRLDSRELLDSAQNSAQVSIEKFLLNNIKGFSPLLCREICHRAGADGNTPAAALPNIMRECIIDALDDMAQKISEGRFSPCMVYAGEDLEKPLDFHCIEIMQYRNVKSMDSISEVLDKFYVLRDNAERMKQKKADLLKVISNSIVRCNKKLFIQQLTLRDVTDREKLKLYGELITANIYCIPKNVKVISLLNYYSENGEYIEIPLDENKLPQENAQRYFKKYAKAKSTFAYTGKQLEETRKELDYLESVLYLLENCISLQETDEVRQELADQGYMVFRKKPGGKKHMKPSEPLHYKSSDGLDILVGKNNRQNDYLTLKLASSNDMWLHTKNIPGSHVIIRKTLQSIPENTLHEAALLAAYHSKARMSSSVPVDYTIVKNVNKPSGAKPGMVIYVNYKTIVVKGEVKGDGSCLTSLCIDSLLSDYKK